MTRGHTSVSKMKICIVSPEFPESRRIIQQLRDEHFEEVAERLDVLLNQTPWTTGSELIGELGLAIRDFLRTRPRVTPALRKDLRECKKMVRRAWGPFFFW